MGFKCLYRGCVMGELAGLAAGAGGGTLFLTIVTRIIKLMLNNKQERRLLKKEVSEHNLKVFTEARNYNPWQAWVGRFMLISVALGMLAFASIYGALNPDVAIYFPEQQEDVALRILGFEIFHFELSGKVTWQQLNGIVILPIWSLIIGSAVGLLIGRAITD